MRIRTQLILAFFVLAVLPLTGIVLYSYHSSQNAVRAASAQQAKLVAEQMDERMASIRSEVSRRLENVSEILVGDSPEAAKELLREVEPAAELFDKFEIIPTPPQAAQPPQPPQPPQPILIDVEEIVREARAQAIDPETARALGKARRAEAAAIRAKARAERAKRMVIVTHPIEVPMRRHGANVGTVRAEVRGEAVLDQILRRADRTKGEVPFAVDPDGKLLAASEEDRKALAAAGVAAAPPRNATNLLRDNWVIASSHDPASGMTFGVVRPIHDSLDEVRNAAGRNFLYGLTLIGIALLGIAPVANHISRDVKVISAGAERIAGGDLDTEVPVRSKNEFGQLALAFNRMARDLKEHQTKLIETGIEQRLLKTEFERKSAELEQARQFQLSLLPKSLPQNRFCDVAVMMRTATEVGGDYYDFQSTDDSLIAVIGDATGHGATAGTMVTIIKSLFSAFPPEGKLSDFLREATATIKRMELGRMAMALTIARITPNELTIAAAGMPPLLIYRAGEVREIAIHGTPLGTIAFDYTETRVPLASGDTLLLTSDGFPELLNEAGEPLGYKRVSELFERVASDVPASVIDRLSAEIETWRGDQPPNDDVTFLVVKMV